MKFELNKSECVELCWALRTEYQVLNGEKPTLSDLLEFFTSKSEGLTHIILLGWEDK